MKAEPKPNHHPAVPLRLKPQFESQKCLETHANFLSSQTCLNMHTHVSGVKLVEMASDKHPHHKPVRRCRCGVFVQSGVSLWRTEERR